MNPIFDIHCHPSLKVYLCNADFSAPHKPESDFIPGEMHYDLPGMAEGNVKIIISYQYVPEQGLLHMSTAGPLIRLLQLFGVHPAQRFERNDATTNVFLQVQDGISRMNAQVQNAPAEFNAVIPLNLAEFETAYAAGKTIIMHAMEGAHHLGRNLGSVQAYLDNLAALKAKGLCVMTLSHFFPNDVSDSAGGIPPTEAKLFGFKHQDGNPPGLTPVGEAVVNWCQDNGVIIDLVHSSVPARNTVWAILKSRSDEGKIVRPVIFSHTGIRTMIEPLMTSPTDPFVLPGDDEIVLVHKYGGTLGMIFMNYWQDGEEQQRNIFVNDPGISHVVDTMEQIKDMFGDVNCISIGSDLDGFTTVPHDIPHVSYIQRLVTAMRNRVDEDGNKVFTDADIEQICFGNALRVLRAGWS